jgi:ABC-type transport system substrate-binding protein
MKKYIVLTVIALTIIVMWVYVSRHKNNTTVKSEKVLMIANEAHISGLDPIQSDDIYSARELAKVYEGLLEFHYLKRPIELSPNLAEAMPTVSADQLVYTFKIRQGVMFHDNPCFPNNKGRELTAHDFIYSLKRLADPKLQAKGFWLIDNKLKGLDQWRKKQAEATVTDYQEEIEGIKALDKYTLQFTLTRPYPQFLYALAMSPCYVVAHEAVTHYGEEFLNHPVGTGPFMLEGFTTQDSKLVYHKNPTFRDKYFPHEAAEEYKHMLAYAGKKLPLVDKIVTYILPEEQPRWLKFKKGDIDLIDLSRDQRAAKVVQDKHLLPEVQKKGVQLLYVPELGTSYIIINMAHPLFKDNPKLRQAMSLALDTEGFNKLFYNNMAVAAQSTIPPGLAGYQADYKNPYRTYDLEKAKEYLAAAGYPGGKGLPEITLEVGSTTDLKQKGEFIQKCMEKIGIRIKVVENIFPALVKKINTKSTMLHVIGWSADYPDAENFLQLFYGPNQPGGVGSNFNDPTFNSCYETVASMPDSPARTMLYEQLNQIVGENVPAICMVHPPHINLVHGWVKNYCWTNFHYGTEQYWDIDLSQKKSLLAKL